MADGGRNSSIDVKPVTGYAGAEIGGVDLSRPFDDRICAEIRAALNTWGVIFFRDQNLTPEQHLDLARRFGPLHASGYGPPVAGHPGVIEVRKEPDQRRNVGGEWHSDHSFDPAPPLGSILIAREMPEAGGDTAFASLYAAYESLSPALKKTLEGLRAVHSKRLSMDPDRLSADRQPTAEEIVQHDAIIAKRPSIAVHDVCPRHPESGRRVLFISPSYMLKFEGWTVQESKGLMEYLCQHVARQEHVCRFRWEKNSVAFWDNRSILHYAVNDYHGDRRVLHRVTVEGPTFARA